MVTAIQNYIDSLPAQKRADMNALHERIRRAFPKSRLWWLDGKNADGKVVSNPNIGYGMQHLSYADGSTKEFYQVGLSANTTGISLYIMGVADKKFLANTFEKKIGKASITGYCIKFKRVSDIDLAVFDQIVRVGLIEK